MNTEYQEVTASRILKAALKIFAEKGFYEATTRQIAKEADVNIASLNYHFQSKNGLLNAVLNEYVAPQVRESAMLLTNTPDTESEIVAQIEEFLKKLLESYFAHTEIFHFYMRVLDSNEAVLKGILPLIDSVFNSVNSFLQRGKEKGVILHNSESDVASIMILTSFVGLIKNELSLGRVYPVSLMDERFVDRFFNQMVAKAIL